jgi:hypothetical protein
MIDRVFQVMLLVTGACTFAESGNVTLVVTDAFGTPITRSSARLERDGQVTVLQSGTPTNLEYGTYDVTVQVPGFKTTRQRATVGQPRQVISVAMELGSYEAPQIKCSVTGRIDPGAAAIRVRAMEMFGATSIDVAADKEGYYALIGLECGDYMLMAMGSKGCLAVQFRRMVRDVRIDFHPNADTVAACEVKK